MCKGCYQDSIDKDDTYASTPLLISLKLPLLIGLSKNCRFTFCGISTAFLHAKLQDEVYVKPPMEFYPDGGILWRLQKAMRGLKTAPQAWLLHFAETLAKMGAKRLRSQHRVYYFSEKNLCNICVMSYADEGLTVLVLQSLCAAVAHRAPIREIRSEGKNVPSLGRVLQRDEKGIHLQAPKAYINAWPRLWGYRKKAQWEPVGTTGSSAPKRTENECLHLALLANHCGLSQLDRL